MLRGTCYYNKKIKVENVAESAKILTNVQTFRDCALGCVHCVPLHPPITIVKASGYTCTASLGRTAQKLQHCFEIGGGGGGRSGVDID